MCLESSVREQEEFGTILGSIPALTDVDALPWEAGGKTDLANAVLLCWHHHALVHREKIAIAHHSGGFVFTSPDGKTMGTRKHGT